MGTEVLNHGHHAQHEAKIQQQIQESAPDPLRGAHLHRKEKGRQVPHPRQNRHPRLPAAHGAARRELHQSPRHRAGQRNESEAPLHGEGPPQYGHSPQRSQQKQSRLKQVGSDPSARQEHHQIRNPHRERQTIGREALPPPVRRGQAGHRPPSSSSASLIARRIIEPSIRTVPRILLYAHTNRTKVVPAGVAKRNARSVSPSDPPGSRPPSGSRSPPVARSTRHNGPDSAGMPVAWYRTDNTYSRLGSTGTYWLRISQSSRCWPVKLTNTAGGFPARSRKIPSGGVNRQSNPAL